MAVIAILQARLGARRLPQKTIKEVGGVPLLAIVIRRLKRSKRINKIVVATTNSDADIAIVNVAKKEGVASFRGSENDVLDRYYQAAKANGAGHDDIIVRVTADCPLLDADITDIIINKFIDSKGAYDYVCNTQPPTYPDGLDTEVFLFATLERAWNEAKLASEREHVTPYIWKQPDKFRMFNVTNDNGNLSHMRWTVDEPEDLEFIRKIYKMLGEKGKTHDFNMSDVLKLIEKHPDVTKINADFERNEGYVKSVKDDKEMQ